MDDKLTEPPLLVMSSEINVKQILASVLDISLKDLGEDVVFESLGLDSLTSIEALHALRSEFGLELPSDFFANYPTAHAVEEYFSSQFRAGTKYMEANAVEYCAASEMVSEHADSRSLIKALGHIGLPVCLQESTTDRVPLFLIHDGSGLINYYDRLSSLNRPTWGIYNPHFVTAQPWDSVTQMAISYADYVSSQTTGPVILGGKNYH